jgi:hypothetical protein
VCGQSGSAADRALRELPHEQIAVQWDVAVEIGLLATGFGTEPADFDAGAPVQVTRRIWRSQSA